MNVSRRQKLIGNRPAIVLLAEDNESDIELTRLAFEQGDYSVQLHVTVDGEDCLEFLNKQGRHAQAPTPDIVLLDLHMPRMSGLEVLEKLMARTSPVPIVVLTTSDAGCDIDAAYRLRCHGYVVKPVGFSHFLAAIHALETYWFDLVVLPQGASPV